MDAARSSATAARPTTGCPHASPNFSRRWSGANRISRSTSCCGTSRCSTRSSANSFRHGAGGCRIRSKFCLDSVLPLGCSQHQKIIVVDDSLAFSGGLDLTTHRWDTSEHKLHNPDRCTPDGREYAPFHDIQALVDGDAARALADLARERWKQAKGAGARASQRHQRPLASRPRAGFAQKSTSGSRAPFRLAQDIRKCARLKRCSATRSRPRRTKSTSRTSSSLVRP